ncbi:MAG: transcriptional regulator PpsR [Polynucleobacter sp.]|jgi:transcriptional regulator PpsR|nr:transcriptional regulator PpsR [Polynucleobacter sp.]
MNIDPTKIQKHIDNIDAQTAAHLVSHVADAVVIMDQQGMVENVINTQTPGLNALQKLVGSYWIDHTAIDSKKKVAALLNPKDAEESHRWRQINILMADGSSLPLMMSTIQVYKDNKIIAVGKDLRNLANLQQRLVEAQQAIETDYLRLRFAEARYKQLFDLSLTAHVILDGNSFKILEVNPVANELLADSGKKLLGKSMAEFINIDDFPKFQDILNTTRNTNLAKKIQIKLTKNLMPVEFTANFLREENQTVFLINLIPHAQTRNIDHQSQSSQLLLNAIDSSADSFVVTDSLGTILSANKTFLKMVHLEKREQVIGESFDNYLGRSNIDLKIILNNLKDRDSVNHYATTLVPNESSDVGDEVEISAVKAQLDGMPVVGFSLRRIGPRITQRNRSSDDDVKKTAHKLTELVGRVPLREIVSETTDMIEKLCIMSALDLTMNNRVSASEMLGLSRQSLYIKMRRFGITEPSSPEDI